MTPPPDFLSALLAIVLIDLVRWIGWIPLVIGIDRAFRAKTRH